MNNKELIVKVCGMCDAERMHQLSKLSVNMTGFVFYSKSPRYVVGKIDPSEILKLNKKIKKVGVFVNSSEDEILSITKNWNLDTIQLHGNESPEMCKKLKSEGFIIIKALSFINGNDNEKYAPYCDYFLYDTPSHLHGGTGQKFDWSVLEQYNGSTPFLLSGGIDIDDADRILSINHPRLAGIDINSKFELEPGIKDIEKIEIFLSKIKHNTKVE